MHLPSFRLGDNPVENFSHRFLPCTISGKIFSLLHKYFLLLFSPLFEGYYTVTIIFVTLEEGVYDFLIHAFVVIRDHAKVPLENDPHYHYNEIKIL